MTDFGHVTLLKKVQDIIVSCFFISLLVTKDYFYGEYTVRSLYHRRQQQIFNKT